jgi:hypothetical protein
MRRTHKEKVYTAALLRRTYREGGKVKHETLGNISHLSPDLIDIVQRSLKGEKFVSATEAMEIARSMPHGHVAAALGAIRKLGLDRILSKKRRRERDLVVGMIVSRVLNPRSKLATARGFAKETALSSLPEILDVESARVNELYSALDWLGARQERIEEQLCKRRLSSGSLVLYDVTSVYVEGRRCPLAKLGYNRDKKKGKLQIVAGLLCDRSGRPLAVEVFEGNTADPYTLSPQIEKV